MAGNPKRSAASDGGTPGSTLSAARDMLMSLARSAAYSFEMRDAISCGDGPPNCRQPRDIERARSLAAVRKEGGKAFEMLRKESGKRLRC